MKARGIDFSVCDSGCGSAIIWGHGLLCNMAVEDAMGVPGFAHTGTDLRWIRYDARGHGGSSATYEPPDYTWPQLAEDALALAHAVGEDQAIFGGLSMGCATALHVATSAPDRVRGLLLVAPPTAWQTRPRQALAYRIAACVVQTIGLRQLCWLAGLAPMSDDDSIGSKMQRGMLGALEGADERAMVAAMRGAAVSDLPSPKAIERIDVPTLILAWRGDPVHPLSTARRLAELIPHAKLFVAGNLQEITAWPQRLTAFRDEVNNAA